jgi:hypothetical protein
VRTLLAGLVLAVAGLPAPTMGKGPALAVRASGGWETWWHADSAPAAWRAPLPAITERVRWQQVAPGLERGEFSLSGDGEAFRVRVIVARLDPAELEFRLVKPADGKVFAGRWSVDEAPDDAIFAVNAGQFTDNRPWGWLVQDGVERQVPGQGPLAPGIVVDGSGAVRLVSPDSLAAVRGSAALAFQSYPTLLAGDGEVPLPLQRDGMGVDRRHRDARLAFGLQRDGKVIIAMTRFEALGGVLENIPLGLTTPEMAAVMGALGASSAVLLDGGISSQMLIRSADGVELWTGWRRVALGLVAVRRGGG